MSRSLRIALLGHRFMGRAHSNAWSQVSRFFDLPFHPVLQVACGRDVHALQEFAQRWGWAGIETDWRRVLERDDVDIVDIALPQHLHAEVAVAAAQAGKHVFCEKPLAMTPGEGRAMVAAAGASGIVHYVNHNYRLAPAVVLARQLIDEGRIGEIRHWRGAYQQSWLVDPAFPLNWKLRQATAYAGPQWDLNSHNVDLALHLVGDITHVSCLTRTFIPERPLEEDPSRSGPVEVEDAALMMADFACGAVGSFEATRFALGRRNRHTFEIYGSKGALSWDLEDMNRLQFFSEDDPPQARGFRNLLATERIHRYAKNWWPPGHIIGYEHTFVHAVADFLTAVATGGPAKPDFRDGLRVLEILEAGLQSAASGRKCAVPCSS